ncbi:MAG: aquaporin [Deltaproteobacteria bacterium]|nr:aquaporin [Deltaproteobacteria bacterium]
MRDALKRHWPEYLIEAACLGLFMVSAFTFGTILEHPASPVRQTVPNPLMRRFLMGLAMGSSAIAIIYSRWGKQSGGHINPSTTLTFYRLGKVAPWDTLFYIVFQFIGGLTGALLASVVLSGWVSHPSVHYVVTTPGTAGAGVAFIAETGITFILMTVILNVSNNMRLHKFTGLCAGALVATYITFEAPVSGMSMNPARTFASAVPAHHWTALWVYVTAPVIGMLAAAEVYVRLNGTQSVACAKLHHQNHTRCIFCGKAAAQGERD